MDEGGKHQGRCAYAGGILRSEPTPDGAWPPVSNAHTQDMYEKTGEAIGDTRLTLHAPVKVGDLLVTGNVEGVAMKSEPVEVGRRKMARSSARLLSSSNQARARYSFSSTFSNQ
jgi:hypothetical protein